MTYADALEFWFGRINYEQRTLRPGDIKLERMEEFAQRLGNPHQIPIVHIAGSKGKGSTAAMLARVVQEAGYKTGLFTSPHLSRIEERIQIDGVPIQEDELCQLMDKIEAVVGAMDAETNDARARVTFFEIATALGFLHFQQQQVDCAIVEVGLGGRFDSTNICAPLLSIITTISFDHVRQLGNTLARIAFEKAGIIKNHRPVICGVTDGEPRRVIEDVCHERGAPLRLLERDFHFAYDPGEVTPGGDRLPRVQVSTQNKTWPAMNLRLLGQHQAANAALVVAAVEELQRLGFSVVVNALLRGLENVHWPARMEVVSRRPLIVLDCAHNTASAEALLQTLQTSFPKTDGASQRWLIFAGSYDKDVAGILRVLAPHFDHAWLTKYANNPRFVPPEELARILQSVSPLPHTIVDDAARALHLAKERARPTDLICITGSVFLAGELRPLLVDGLS